MSRFEKPLIWLVNRKLLGYSAGDKPAPLEKYYRKNVFIQKKYFFILEPKVLTKCVATIV